MIKHTELTNGIGELDRIQVELLVLKDQVRILNSNCIFNKYEHNIKIIEKVELISKLVSNFCKNNIEDFDRFNQSTNICF